MGFGDNMGDIVPGSFIACKASGYLLCTMLPKQLRKLRILGQSDNGVDLHDRLTASAASSRRLVVCTI